MNETEHSAGPIELRADTLTNDGPMGPTPHSLWVRLTHWIVSASFLALAFSGFVILMSHPRLYWGEAGNDLTVALFELPISRNYHHHGFDNSTPFYDDPTSPVSASRTYDIFNKNGWARSLHFLAGWFLVVPGAVYLAAAIFTGHLGKNLLPRSAEVTPPLIWREIKNHLHLLVRPPTGGPQYGLLQKCSYFGVVILALPLTIITGLGMSPAISASYPFLSGVFGGLQSARTIHFFAFALLMLFLVVHVLMVIKSGFKRQMRAMTLGE